jgi:hypothetical protein
MVWEAARCAKTYCARIETPSSSAVSFVGSLRSGKSACCYSANAVFSSSGSTLIMK